MYDLWFFFARSHQEPIKLMGSWSHSICEKQCYIERATSAFFNMCRKRSQRCSNEIFIKFKQIKGLLFIWKVNDVWLLHLLNQTCELSMLTLKFTFCTTCIDIRSRQWGIWLHWTSNSQNLKELRGFEQKEQKISILWHSTINQSIHFVTEKARCIMIFCLYY